jgi:ribosomal protein S3
MGQKVNPIGLRLGINKTWKSRWYVDPKEYAATLHEDLKLRRALAAFPEVQNADVSDVEIVRQPQRITLLVNTARPGVLIGAKGANIERISGDLQKLVDKKVSLKIKEIKKPDVDAGIIAKNVARQLRNRGSFRRASEDGRGQRDERRGSRDQDQDLRSSGRGRYVPGHDDERRSNPAAHFPCGHRLRNGGSRHHLRYHWCESLDLQR